MIAHAERKSPGEISTRKEFASALYATFPRNNGENAWQARKVIVTSFLDMKSLLKNQYRKNGEPSIVHATFVGAQMLRVGMLDPRLHSPVFTIAGLEHDTLEDMAESRGGRSIIQYLRLSKENQFEVAVDYFSSLYGPDYGHPVAEIVYSISKFKPKGEPHHITLAKYLQHQEKSAIAFGAHVLLPKIPDKAHNISTLSSLSLEKQIETLVETEQMVHLWDRVVLPEYPEAYDYLMTDLEIAMQKGWNHVRVLQTLEKLQSHT